MGRLWGWVAGVLVAGVLALPSLIVAGTAAAADEEEVRMKVATYNIRFDTPSDGVHAWPHRERRVAEVLAAFDVAGLQEVEIGQMEDLRERMPEFAFYGVGRADGKEGGEFSPVAVRRDRFEVLADDTFWLSPTPEEAGSVGWDASLPRIATWVRLRDRKNDRTLLFINTHFDHRGPEARERSAALIVERLPEIRKDGDPVVLTGDLNCQPGSAPYRRLAEAGGEQGTVELRDAYELAEPQGPEGTFIGFGETPAPARRIDYIFVSGEFEVDRHETLDPRTEHDRPASDHRPVVAELRW